MPVNNLTGSSPASTYNQLLHIGTGDINSYAPVYLGNGTMTSFAVSTSAIFSPNYNSPGTFTSDGATARWGFMMVKAGGVNNSGLYMSADGVIKLNLRDTAGKLAELINFNNGLDFIIDGAWRMTMEAGGTIRPGSNGTQSLGTAAYRWSQLFAATTTISTSDARQKQQIRPLSEAETAVALALKPMLRAFKFNDAVAAKGDDARIHIGIIAQEVVAAFAAEGLDAADYALLCYDEWDAIPEKLNEDGTVSSPAIAAGNAYGIRYEQLLAFMLAAL